MKTQRLSLLLALLATGPCLPPLSAADTPAPSTPPAAAPNAKIAAPASAKIKSPDNAQGGFIFTLFPKSAQKNPKTDLSAICEMTDEGRKRPVVTPENPATYLSVDMGFVEAGDTEGARMPDKVALQKTLERALAKNGFHPVAEGGTPDYALIFHWGTHTKSPENDTLGDILSRAVLVGGKKFASELKEVLLEQSKNYVGDLEMGEDGIARNKSIDLAKEQLQKAIPKNNSVDEGLTSATGTSVGASINDMVDSMTPLERYKRSDPRKEFLVEQTLSSIYFVIITALDPVAASQKKKVLLWRARMSVEATGLSLADALPSMISNSASFLGRDMDEAATMTPNLIRGKESVDIGETTVVEEGKPSGSGGKK